MRDYLKKAVQRPPESDEAVRAIVAEVLSAVREAGDGAVRRYSEQFDRWQPPSFRLGAAEIDGSMAGVSPSDRAKIDYCRDQIATFARHQRESMREFEVEQQPGVTLGQRLIPVDTVGAYVPGGRYPLVASALMSITTAKVAGVRRIIACSPPSPVGLGNPVRASTPPRCTRWYPPVRMRFIAWAVCNHILPTGRAARYTGGLWVGKFIKTVTYQRLTRAASARVAPIVSRICEIEGMLAHKATADLRARRYTS